MVRSEIKKLREKIVAQRPALRAVLQKNSGESLFAYWEKIWKQPEQHPIYIERQSEFIDVLKAETNRLFGKEVADQLTAQIKEGWIVSTADHHGPTNHPFFLNAHLLSAAMHPEKYIPVLACANVSMNNSSFPRGVFYTSTKFGLQKIPFFNHADNSPVFKHPAFVRINTGQASEPVAELIEDIYSTSKVFAAFDYADQSSITNFKLFKKILPASKGLITLQSEKIAIELLKKLCGDSTSSIYAILFDEKTRSKVFELFDGIDSAFSSSGKRGTFLFWRLDNGKRLPLWPHENQLVTVIENYHLELNPESLYAALENGDLIPSNMLCLVLISFYYGIICFGGFSQIQYLPAMQQAYALLLQYMERSEEAVAARSVDASRFGSDIAFTSISANNSLALASGIDCAVHTTSTLPQEILGTAKHMSIEESIDSLLPEFHKILFKTTSEVTTSDIIAAQKNTLRINKRSRHIHCMYCGANQISHRGEWIQQNAEIIIGPSRRLVVYNPAAVALQNGITALTDMVVRAAAKVGFFEYNDDWEKIKSFRGQELFKEAKNRGIEIHELRPQGNSADLYEAHVAGDTIIFKGLPRPKGYSNVALDWADDKGILKEKLRAAGLPVADGGSAHTWQGALKIFRRIHKPVIVKPRIGSRGRHTTTFIYTEEQLRKAYAIAKQLCSWMVIEEHLTGAVYRGTVIDGKCIGVLGGDPPHITGDGEHTISELIALKNEHKNPHVRDIVIDEKMKQFLGRSDYTLKTILPAGTQIDVNEKIGVSYGGSSFEATPETHPDTIKMFEDAAAIIKDPLLGFDFIISDITKSWKEQKCGILECNAVPFINLHHDPLRGEPINAAKYVWDMIERFAVEKK